VLLLVCSRRLELRVGSLGVLRFEPGLYAYVGSASRGVIPRLRRHMSREKRLRWHIDYLTAGGAEPLGAAVLVGASEQEVAEEVVNAGDPVPGFGASDSKLGSHLARVEDPRRLANALARLASRYDLLWFDGRTLKRCTPRYVESIAAAALSQARA